MSRHKRKNSKLADEQPQIFTVSLADWQKFQNFLKVEEDLRKAVNSIRCSWLAYLHHSWDLHKNSRSYDIEEKIDDLLDVMNEIYPKKKLNEFVMQRHNKHSVSCIPNKIKPKVAIIQLIDISESDKYSL